MNLSELIEAGNALVDLLEGTSDRDFNSDSHEKDWREERDRLCRAWRDQRAAILDEKMRMFEQAEPEPKPDKYATIQDVIDAGLLCGVTSEAKDRIVVTLHEQGVGKISAAAFIATGTGTDRRRLLEDLKRLNEDEIEEE